MRLRNTSNRSAPDRQLARTAGVASGMRAWGRNDGRQFTHAHEGWHDDAEGGRD